MLKDVGMAEPKIRENLLTTLTFLLYTSFHIKLLLPHKFFYHLMQSKVFLL